jgi:type II secretory pathway pseudopilin PulG
MKLMHLSVGLIIFGLLLMAGSVAWPYIIQTRGGMWTEQQALEHAKIAANLHRLGHQRAHIDDGSPKTSHNDAALNSDANYEKAKISYQQSDAQLRSAQFWSQDVADWIKWCGCACCLFGTILFHYIRRKYS